MLKGESLVGGGYFSQGCEKFVISRTISTNTLWNVDAYAMSKQTRRSFLRKSAVTTVGLSALATGAGTAAAKEDNLVPKGVAKTRAKSKVQQLSRRDEFSGWKNARLGTPTTFHMRNTETGPKYLRSAYVFPVQKQGNSVGYVTAAAQSSWAPILEYSKATPPTTYVQPAKAAARSSQKSLTGNLLYHGGVEYGLELASGEAMNVRNKISKPLGNGISPDSMAFKSDQVAAQKDALSSDSETVTTDAVTPQALSDTIADVPAWTSTDSGGASSTSYGTGDDEWADWDGCSPIAGSMIIAYHEGVNEWETNEREAIIDHLHDTMLTDDDTDAATNPIDLDRGFNQYTWGDSSYSGQNIYLWNHPDFTKAEISDNNRPFLLNMTSGGTAEDRSQAYGNHTTTVVGYKDDGETLELHDTWDYTSHYLSWGSWTAASYTKVTTS